MADEDNRINGEGNGSNPESSISISKSNCGADGRVGARPSRGRSNCCSRARRERDSERRHSGCRIAHQQN